MAIVDILLDIAPEYAIEDSSKLGRFIGYAAEDVNREFFGTRADRATAYLAAHMLARSAASSSAAGAVTSEKVGDVSVSYAVNSAAGAADLATTSYGSEFVRLRKACYKGPFAV